MTSHTNRLQRPVALLLLSRLVHGLVRQAFIYFYKPDNSTCSLELNIHQRILTDIASNNDGAYAQELISSKVETRSSAITGNEHKVKEVDKSERFYMVYWPMTFSYSNTNTRISLHQGCTVT
jgi:hypothetical protein